MAPEGRLAKAAGAEPCGQMRDEKLHNVVARRCAKHISKSKCTQSTTCLRHFWTLKRRFCFAHLVKGEQFCSISKNDGRRGTFEEDLKDA